METQIDVKNPKLKRTLERFKAKIAEGDFYEAHQTLRSIANRNVRSKAYADAIDLLYHAAQILLQSSQPATGSDLISYLVEVYVESETKVDAESKSKLIHLISLFSPEEPTLKQIDLEITNWSVKFGAYKFGDPELHYALGSKFVQNSTLAYEAEKHLVMATNAAVPLYIDHIWEWYMQDPTPENVGAYFSRCVLNYLFALNVKAANEALSTLLERLTSEKKEFTHTSVTEGGRTVIIFDQLPMLNLLQLLLATIEKGDQQLFRRLIISRYGGEIEKAGLKDAFNIIGQEYFKIPVPKQVNLLQDMMSMFGGGGR